MNDPAAAKASGARPDLSEARLRAMLDASGAALLALDAGGVIVEATRMAAGLLGAGPAALAGRQLREIAPGWTEAEQASLHSAGVWRGVIEFRAGGTPAALAAEISAIGGDGERSYVADLRDAGAATGAYPPARDAIARVAHDLRNPLTALRGQAQLLKRRIVRGGEADPGRMLAGLDAIEEAADRMAALIDGLAAQAEHPAGAPPDGPASRGPR